MEEIYITKTWILWLHQPALNSADLNIAQMTKKSWKFLHSAEPWYSTDKNLKNNLHNAKTLV